MKYLLNDMKLNDQALNTRRQVLKGLSLGAFAGLFPTGNLLANFLQDKDWETELIRNNVGLFKGKGGTIGWLMSGEGTAAIDSQFPDSVKHFIDSLNLAEDQQVNILFNSHHHGDHTGGNIAFKGIVSKVVAHENSRTNQEATAKSRGNESSQLYPDTVFKDQWSEKIGDETITTRYFGAAHTNGDSVIHFENANVAHVGDLVFNRRHPYIDRSAGANIANWITVLENIRKTYDTDTLFICGHAGNNYDVKITHKDIQAQEKYFDRLLAFAKKEIKGGKSQEEILKATELPGLSWQDENLSRPLKAAYEELTGK